MKHYDFKVYTSQIETINNQHADNLYEAGCNDAIVCYSADNRIHLEFHRKAKSLAHAVESAVLDVQKVGINITKVLYFK